MAAVRYLVKDVDRSIAFYTGQLGFKVDMRAAPAFASVSKGDLIVRLSGPGSSGARPMPGGREQEPRNEMETGPGGRQIQIEDPDGNPIEVFQPASG